MDPEGQRAQITFPGLFHENVQNLNLHYLLITIE